MKKELSNIDVALFALYKLGGVTKKIHTEKIACEAYTLAKERFSWRLPEFRAKGMIDKSPVRFALEQAKKKENGKLITGRAGGDIGGEELEGWQFTPTGAIWIKENEARIVKELCQEKVVRHKVQDERFIRKIKNDPLFKLFQGNKTLDNVSRYLFTDMLVCAPDASINIINKKLNQIIANANLLGDKEIIYFLKTCKEKFI